MVMAHSRPKNGNKYNSKFKTFSLKNAQLYTLEAFVKFCLQPYYEFNTGHTPLDLILICKESEFVISLYLIQEYADKYHRSSINHE